MSDSLQPDADGPRRRAVELVALTSFAILAPLLDVLGEQPDFFAAQHIEGTRLVALIATLTIGPPLILGLAEQLVGAFGQRARVGCHLAITTALMMLAALPPLNRAGDLPAWATVGMAAALAGVGVWAIHRFSPVREALGLLSIAVLILPAMFFLRPPIHTLAFAPTAVADSIRLTSTTPLVVVIFDELPLAALLDQNEQIDGLRFPNFERLAAQSSWYRNATTVSGETLKAIPTILTGLRPQPGLISTAADHPRSLFTLVGESHDLHVTETVTDLCPASLCAARRTGPSMDRLLGDLGVIYLHVVLPTDARSDLPSLDQRWGGFTDGDFLGLHRGVDAMLGELLDDREQDFERFLASIESSERPGLFLIHLMLPHVPYEYLPSGTRYNSPSYVPHGLDPQGVWIDEVDSAIAQQRFLLQVGFTDKLIGRLLDRLESTAILDDALVVVVADHGSSFVKGRSHRVLGVENAGDILPVPLFIKRPGQRRGEIIDDSVETIDILPTVAGLIGAELPWEVDGRSLLSAEPARETKIAVLGRTGRESHEFPASFAARRDGLERKLERFGARTPLESLGLYPQDAAARGSPIASLKHTGAEDLVLDLEQPHLFGDIDPSSGFVPALVRGRIRGARAVADARVAIAVNGTVETVVMGRPAEDGSLDFSAMLPEAAFRTGANQIEALVLDDGPSARSGRYAAPAHERHELIEENGSLAIRMGDRSHPVLSDAPAGTVERTAVFGNRVELDIRLDPARPRRLDRVLVFQNHSLVHSHGLATDGGPTAQIRFNLAAPGVGLRIFGLGADGKARAFEVREAP